MRDKKIYEDLVLSEARKDTITIAWGRFNPPTTGHEKLINTVAAVARKRSADYRIYPTKTSDIKKNPLTFKEKVRFMRQMFRRHARNISAAEGVNTLIKAAQQLEKEGYKNLILVAGSDRTQEFNTLLNKYNGSDYKFDSINVVSAGERDPDAEDVSGMSASKMRAAASAGNFNEFKKGVPNKRMAKALYDAVRTGMRVVETFEKDGVLELFDEVEEEHKLLEEGILKKAVVGTVVAAIALKTLKKMEKKRKLKKLKATKGPEEIEEPKEVSVPGGIEGPKFDRLLRFGLSVGGTGDIPLTKRAFRNFDYSQTNPILRKKVFATTQRAFHYLLHDKLLYHRLVILLQRKQQFQEDTNAMKFNEVRTKIIEAEGQSPISTEPDHPERLNFIGKFPSGDYTKSFIDDINRAGLAKITWVSSDGREVQFHLISSIAGQEVGGGETPDAMRDPVKRMKQSSVGFGADAKVIDIAMKHGGKISRFDGDIREGLEERDDEATIQDKTVENLIKRAWKSDIAYDILSEIYLRGVQTWEEECENKENMLPEQWAFSRVNSFIANGKSRTTCDIDLWEEHLQRESEENSEMDDLFLNETKDHDEYNTLMKKYGDMPTTKVPYSDFRKIEKLGTKLRGKTETAARPKKSLKTVRTGLSDEYEIDEIVKRAAHGRVSPSTQKRDSAEKKRGRERTRGPDGRDWGGTSPAKGKYGFGEPDDRGHRARRGTGAAGAHEEYEIDEARMGVILRNVKKGTPPYSIVAHKTGRVVDQELTKMAQAVPAFVREMQKKHRNAKISVEDRRGRVLHVEEVQYIDELSKKLLTRYADKAAAPVSSKITPKRRKGIGQALDKISGKAGYGRTLKQKATDSGVTIVPTIPPRKKRPYKRRFGPGRTVFHPEEVDEQFTSEFVNESFEIEFLQEEHGAGFEGTPELDKKYRKDTPGQRNEESPPSDRAERFIKKNKASFNKLYGSKGKERLYATAWKMHNKHWK